MRRGGPLQRKTPLQNKTPMSRGSGFAPSKPRPGSGIRPKRDKPRRRLRDDVDHGMEWPDVRLVIYVRAGGRCEGCGCQLNIANMEGHHRRARRIGPDCPCNAIALCHGCHLRVHSHPAESMSEDVGRIISRHDDTPPAEVKVLVHGLGLTLLSCGGTYL